MSNRLKVLSQRIDRLGLPHKRLSEMAGLDKSTISRALNAKTDPLTSTLDRIERAVVTAEAEMAQHLASLPRETSDAA